MEEELLKFLSWKVSDHQISYRDALLILDGELICGDLN